MANITDNAAATPINALYAVAVLVLSTVTLLGGVVGMDLLAQIGEFERLVSVLLGAGGLYGVFTQTLEVL